VNDKVQGLVSVADENVEAAGTLLAAGHYGISVSRAYYAMFYCASALLLTQGRTFSRHGSVVAAFGRYFAKTGLLDSKLHRDLRRAFRDRQKSDYEVLAGVPREAAEQAVQRAAEFVEATRVYLREHGGEEGGDDA
jgi:uncharacterized protein (UPF0332 family)